MYNAGQEYNIKYINSDGEQKEIKITPEEDINKPQMIMTLKEKDKNFFKLLENKNIIRESVNSMKLFDVLENKNFEDIDITDETYDMMVAYCLDIEDTDKDVTQEFLSKIAKQIDVVNDNGKVVVCDISRWVKNNLDLLSNTFDLSGTNEEENIEELVCDIFPGLVSGYVSEATYSELNKSVKEECVLTEDTEKDVTDMIADDILANRFIDKQGTNLDVKETPEGLTIAIDPDIGEDILTEIVNKYFEDYEVIAVGSDKNFKIYKFGKEEGITPMTEGFDRMDAIMPVDNFHSMGIKVSDDGDTVEYMYSNEDEVYEADIQYNEDGEPYFTAEEGDEYLISEFLRKDFFEGKQIVMEDVDEEEYPIEFNGIKRKVYSKDDLEQWQTIEREIKYLEKYVKHIFIGTGNDSMEVTFGDPNSNLNETMFKLVFDSNLFGRVSKVETTFSNQEVNETFVYLANELYNLSK